MDLIKNLSSLMLIRVLQSASTFFVNMIFFARISSGESAEYALIMSLLLFTGVVIISPVGQFIQINFSNEKQEEFQSAFSTYTIFIIANSVLLFIVLCQIGFVYRLNFFVCLYFLTSNISSLYVSMANLRQNKRLFYQLSILCSILNILSACGFLFLNNISLVKFFITLSIIQALVFLTGLLISGSGRTFLRQYRNVFSFEFFRSGLFVSISAYVQNHFLRLMVPIGVGMAQFEKISILLLVLGQIWNSIETICNQFFDPLLLKKLKENSSYTTITIIRFSIYVLMALLVPAIIHLGIIFQIFPNIKLEAWLIVLISFIYSLKACNLMFLQTLMFIKKIKLAKHLSVLALFVFGFYTVVIFCIGIVNLSYFIIFSILCFTIILISSIVKFKNA